ncbi:MULTISPECIES: metal-dependent hydrolase [Cytobacillus]|uniref:Metal-dependent hydrolase n=2 Tax=Bacillati TaxID=1783272 RepID=A0A2N0ZIE7_9BACI|nr:metal-dependent hydrolase [Cytobacillus horneckiae]PKG29266.1 hypothetical protein CWS20_09220 [Cytobacillus horneckiae]
MIAVTHQTFGITFGLIAIIILQLVGIHPEGIGETIFFFLLVLLGSLLPDLDTTKSKLGRKLWPIAFLISLFVKHRTATHSLLFVGGVIISSGFAVIILKLTWFYALAIGLGTISHITGDWLTSRGVPLLYPFRKERFKAPITFRTGSWTERWICLGLIALNLLLFFGLTNLTIPY